jgi:tetratricopeptide (TPR) repeat protein
VTGFAAASRYSSQLGNIRAALEWSFGPNGADEIATRLAAASTQLFLELSLLIECRVWAERAIVRLGDQHKNSRREMEIYASLSLALTHSEGSSELVRKAFSRALDVAAVIGDFAYELRLLSGLFMYYRWNTDINAALDIASRSKEVALKTRDHDDVALAESMLGAAHFLTGNHLIAIKHFESGLIHSASGSRFRAGQHLFHNNSLLLVGMARSLLCRGLLDQSLDYARLAIEEGERSNHPATLCRSLSFVLPVYLALADSRRAERYIAQLTELAAAYSLKPYRAIATGLRGQWLLLRNDLREGISLLKRALEELHTQRHDSLDMEFLCDLGAGLIATGEHQEALTLTVNAIDVQQRGGKFLYMPALFRMKGLILASRSAEDYSEAEGSLLSAIDWAKRQSAALFELKAATDLAELLLKQDRLPEGYKHLSAALDRTPAGIVSPTYTRALPNPQPAAIRKRGRRLKRHLRYRALSAQSASSPRIPIQAQACSWVHVVAAMVKAGFAMGKLVARTSLLKPCRAQASSWSVVLPDRRAAPRPRSSVGTGLSRRACGGASRFGRTDIAQFAGATGGAHSAIFYVRRMHARRFAVHRRVVSANTVGGICRSVDRH